MFSKTRTNVSIVAVGRGVGRSETRSTRKQRRKIEEKRKKRKKRKKTPKTIRRKKEKGRRANVRGAQRFDGGEVGRCDGASGANGGVSGEFGPAERCERSAFRNANRQCVAQRKPRISSAGSDVNGSRRSGGSLRNVSASSRIKSRRCASLANG